MLHLICALKSESRPLVNHFNLEHRGGGEIFGCYCNENNEISLTITGVGKVNAAAGIMYAASRFEIKDNDVWLNIGVAGHGTLPVGTPILAHRITDAGSGKTWYPQLVLNSPCRSLGLITVDSPSSLYEHDMIDMEAAGFYSSASRIGTSELIHCLKIISDNELSPPDKVSGKTVTDLITKNLNTIEILIDQLQKLSGELDVSVSAPENYHKLLEKWHFTQSQKYRLHYLLQRWQVLLPLQESLFESVRFLKSGKDVLLYLEQTLDATPIDYSFKPLRTRQSNPS